MNGLCRKFFAGIISAAIMCSCLTAPMAEVMDSIASVTFDGASDTGYTMQSGASLVRNFSGNAASLTSTDTSYITVDDVSAINSITGDFSFSIWCYPNDSQTWTRLYDFGTGTDKYIFLAPSSTYAQGYPRFVMKNGGDEQVLQSSTALPSGQWSSITVTRADSTTSMYINGEIVSTTSDITLSPSDIGTTTQNYIGKSQYSSDPYFNGMIDQFSVYSRALTQEEIRQEVSENITKIASENDRYIISTQFYNVSGQKIFQINDDSQLKASVYIKNSTITDGKVSAKLYAYYNDVKTELASSEDISLSVGGDTTIELLAEVPENCDYMNVVVTDLNLSQDFDSGYIGKSSVEFPSASPEDSYSTTFGAHDPTIFKDPVSGKYFAYSSHNLIFESEDLINWTKHDYTSTITVPESSKTFITNNYSSATVNSTYWAPDILYVEDDEYPYWFYVSVSCGLGGRNSVIVLLKCKSPGIFDGEYEDAGVVLASKENSYYKTNSIDANIYTDTDGKVYFIWGSFWQGIQAAPLTEDGRIEGIDYTSDATILSSSQNFGKPMFSVPSGVFGPEGPFMVLNEEAGYRYMFVSYGWLGSNYNIRIARSSLETSMETGIASDSSASTFLNDHNGNAVGTAYSGQSDKSKLWGYKMLGSYQLGDGIVYYGNGHNSVLQDDDGNWYLVDHSRKVIDATAYLQVRKMLWTQDGWPVVSPLAYAGEKIQTIDKTMLYGTWDLSSVGHTILKDGVTNIGSCSSADADLPVLSSEIVLQPDGNLAYGLGSWAFDGDHTVTITFARDGEENDYEFYKKGDVMEMYVMTGYDKDKAESAVVMTGVDQNHITQFAKKSNANTADTRPVASASATVITKSTSGNPVSGLDSDGNRIYAGNPAATVINGKVYLYASLDASSGSSYNMTDWVLYTSEDMNTWEYKGSVMSAGSISWASNAKTAYPAQVVEYGGKYYMYFSTADTAESGKQSIGVAVADSPEGPFTDIGQPLVGASVTTPQSSDLNDSSPTVWIETIDGTEHRYLAWGSGKYYMCELNEDMVSVKDKNSDSVIDMNDISKQKISNMGSDTFTSASWLYKRDSKYYTFFTVNTTEAIAYAASSDITSGQWTNCGQIMPPTATAQTNQPSVIDFNGKTYIIYANGALSGGSEYRRSISVEELMFDSSGNVLPVSETSTGLSGTKSTIQSSDGKYISHSDGTNILGVTSVSEENGLNTSWEIEQGLSDSENENYVSIQSVDKPGFYITASDDFVILTHDSDESLSEKMTFKTVEGLSGKGVSFESIYYPGRYLTVIGDEIMLSYGRNAESSSFEIGEASELPTPTAAPFPTPTPMPELTPDISNDFDALEAGTLRSVLASDQTAYTDINGMSIYIGTRSSGADTTSNVAVESGGISGNAIVMNSGKFVSASRGPRIAFTTPVIIENSSAVLTVYVKLSGAQSLRFNDSVYDETGTTITGLSTSSWSKLQCVITDSDGERTRAISVNDTVIHSDAVETFPVLWGTTANGVYAKALIDNMSIQTILNTDYSVSADGADITVMSPSDTASVYAAKYNADGTLAQINVFTLKKGQSEFTAGFEPDKVFVWDSDTYTPYALWVK